MKLTAWSVTASLLMLIACGPHEPSAPPASSTTTTPAAPATESDASASEDSAALPNPSTAPANAPPSPAAGAAAAAAPECEDSSMAKHDACNPAATGTAEKTPPDAPKQ